MTKPLILKPRLSEKVYALSQERNTYVFDIPAHANRLSVARAVATQYKVGVPKVRIAAVRGKTKRTYRKRGASVQFGRTTNIRKAYVTLKDGDKLPLFDAIEEAEAKTKDKGK